MTSLPDSDGLSFQVFLFQSGFISKFLDSAFSTFVQHGNAAELRAAFHHSRHARPFYRQLRASADSIPLSNTDKEQEEEQRVICGLLVVLQSSVRHQITLVLTGDHSHQ